MQQVKSVADIRRSLDTILERARGDEAFGNKLNTQPEETLREAGLHSLAIGEVSQEIRLFLDGKGGWIEFERVRPHRMCDFTTCWISACDHWGTFITSPRP